ncbi:MULTISPECIES: DUF1697 domain-containing protein [Microbacterium]|uniref:DUF1697 domain-containing protein n=1 Tax=Microbacterium TaxID=33882 RepID=UPI00217DDDD6|nr:MULTISPECIES: DUF1697 domain-containing protein [Microbacterium]UWF77089.1 DUF1697 domain-containing protein [Microbacterium neungamense]WCM55249.1 DUF1697 domain-containing protein [Microbacterium sp. EF45047]
MTGRSVLLLRAVNLGARNRVPMAELRALLAERTTLQDVSTYIASGNVLCRTPDDTAAACAEVRALIADAFGVDTPVIPRRHDELVAALARNPFADAAAEKLVHVMFLEDEPPGDAVAALTPRLVPGERIALHGRDLWIDYAAGGVHSTRLTRPVLDRALGVAGTARNVLTVRKLAELTA